MSAFDNSYARLPDRLFARTKPTPVKAPKLVKWNRALAEVLGVELTAEELAGNAIPAGADPIALAYAGHQFGHFVPQLGDGRAILLGEVVARDGARYDLQLKGAGRTRFSRGGDGRAALGPVLREYLVSEAMHALGIPTTRALAAVTTGEPVLRDELLPGAVLTRVAASHLRVGTFEYFAARRDREALEVLVKYALARHYPERETALDLLDGVIERQATLVARWLGVGFVHGVMNTDNTSISGETLDFGPCAFLDTYDPARSFSSIDERGRYAYGNQPRIAQWNCAKLAEALLPLIDEDEDRAVKLAVEKLDAFGPRFERAHLAVMKEKLGLKEDDPALVGDLSRVMAEGSVDFTLFFRRLADGDPSSLFADPGPFLAWAERWRPNASRAAMKTPAFIPRNHRVEEAIRAAHEDDFAPFERLLSVLARPFDDQPEHAELAEPPPKSFQARYRTFCGT